MDKRVLFIDPNRIKSMSVIGENCDEKALKNSLWELQDLDLRNIMTDDYYMELCDQIETASVSEVNAKFLKEAAPYLIYGTVCNYLTNIHFKVTNKGLQLKQDVSANIASGSDLEMLVNTYRGKADTYLRRLIKYLNKDGITNDVPTHNTTESTGLYLGDDYEIDYQKIAWNRANKIR